MAEHGVEALVGDVPVAVDVVGEPGEPAGEGGGDDVDLGCRVDDRAHRGWELVHVGDRGIGDEQAAAGSTLRGPSDRQLRLGGVGCSWLGPWAWMSDRRGVDCKPVLCQLRA